VDVPNKPFRFQQAIIDQLTQTRLFAMYLALEQGLGKTMITLLAARNRGVPRILVLCPAIACLVWEHEVRIWLSPHISVAVLVVRRPFYMPEARTDAPMTLCAVSYDAISRHPDAWRDVIRRFDPKLVVLDEAHRLKSSDAICTRAIYGPRCDRKGSIIEHADNVWALSGTPCPNHTAELWTYLRACAPELITVPL